MPAYHSSFNDADVSSICKVAVLPLKTTARGPAPPADKNANDIIDETLEFFRANTLMTNFEVLGDADRLLVYLTLYTHACLVKLTKATNKADGDKLMYQLAIENFKLPGDAGWPLGGMIPAPANRGEADQLRLFLKQCREELGRRILNKAFHEDGTKNKWWLAFSKRKFMNKQLV